MRRERSVAAFEHIRRHDFSFPRQHAPEFCKFIRPEKRGRGATPKEGAGNAGCPLHPQPVCKGSKHTVVTTGAPGSPGIPARNGFNGFLRALPGDRLVVTVASWKFRET